MTQQFLKVVATTEVVTTECCRRGTAWWSCWTCTWPSSGRLATDTFISTYLECLAVDLPTCQKCHHQHQWFLVQQNEGVVEEEDERLVVDPDQHVGIWKYESCSGRRPRLQSGDGHTAVLQPHRRGPHHAHAPLTAWHCMTPCSTVKMEKVICLFPYSLSFSLTQSQTPPKAQHYSWKHDIFCDWLLWYNGLYNCRQCRAGQTVPTW